MPSPYLSLTNNTNNNGTKEGNVEGDQDIKTTTAAGIESQSTPVGSKRPPPPITTRTTTNNEENEEGTEDGVTKKQKVGEPRVASLVTATQVAAVPSPPVVPPLPTPPLLQTQTIATTAPTVPAVTPATPAVVNSTTTTTTTSTPIKGKEGIDNSQLNKAPIFLQKTYRMIEESSPDLAEWTCDGEMFVVKQPDRFASEMISQYFDHSNFLSFTRQLNFYGFSRLQSKPIRRSEFDATTSKYVTYYNENFQRGRFDLLLKIQRTTRGQSHSSNNNNNNNNGSNTTSHKTKQQIEMDSLKHHLGVLRKTVSDLRESNQALTYRFEMVEKYVSQMHDVVGRVKFLEMLLTQQNRQPQPQLQGPSSVATAATPAITTPATTLMNTGSGNTNATVPLIPVATAALPAAAATTTTTNIPVSSTTTTTTNTPVSSTTTPAVATDTQTNTVTEKALDTPSPLGRGRSLGVNVGVNRFSQAGRNNVGW